MGGTNAGRHGKGGSAVGNLDGHAPGLQRGALRLSATFRGELQPAGLPPPPFTCSS
jgi:hypothetical protein